MNEQEAQQAQKIKRTERVYGLIIDTPLDDIPYPHNVPHQYWLERCRRAELLADSQAQKIQDLQNGKTIGSLHHQIATLEVKVAEARKLAEKMRDASERPGGGHTFLPWERKP